MRPAAWRHQVEDTEASKDLPGAFLQWDARVGKTRVVIDTALHHYQAGRVDCALVVTMSGVHLNWTRDEIPLHWPDDEPYMAFEWRSSATGAKWYQRRASEALRHPGMLWVSVNQEALTSEKCKRFLRNLVSRRRVLLAADESHIFKNPQAKTTKTLISLAEKCSYRRALTATPSPQGPFDLWSQYRIVDQRVLPEKFTIFKHKYALMERVQFGRGKPFDRVVEYRNVDELRRRIGPVTFVRRKADCMDLPERLVTTERYQLPREHERVYEDVRQRFLAELEEGRQISASEGVTRLLRLQQISRGYYQADDEDRVSWLAPACPALERTRDLVCRNDGKAIVWCRFIPDVDAVERELREAGVRVIRCDGGVPKDERPALRDDFRECEDRVAWVGTAATGGVGVDLSAGNLMINYSHGFNAVEREQSMERNYGSRQLADRIDVVDIVADTGLDDKILGALRAKQDLSRKLTPDEFRNMLTRGDQ